MCSRTMQCSVGVWGETGPTPREFWKPVSRTQQTLHLAHWRARPEGRSPAQPSILAPSQDTEVFLPSLPQWSLTCLWAFSSSLSDPLLFQALINSSQLSLPSPLDPEQLHSKELCLIHFYSHLLDKHLMSTYSVPHSTQEKMRMMDTSHESSCSSRGAVKGWQRQGKGNGGTGQAQRGLQLHLCDPKDIPEEAPLFSSHSRCRKWWNEEKKEGRLHLTN